MRVTTVVSDLKNGTYEVLFWLPFEGEYTFSASLSQSCYTHIDLDLDYPEGGDFQIGQTVIFSASRSVVLEETAEVKQEAVEEGSGETIIVTKTFRTKKELPAVPTTPRLPNINMNNLNNNYNFLSDLFGKIFNNDRGRVENNTLPYDRSKFPRCKGQRDLREALGWWEDGFFHHALCDVPFLDAAQIGEKLRNKRILFVGDSSMRFSMVSLMSLRGDSMVLVSGPQLLRGYFSREMVRGPTFTSAMIVDASINFTGNIFLSFFL